MDCSLPGSSVHGIFQARALEWVAISFSRGSSRPRDWTCVSCIAGRRFTIWATREAPSGKESSCQCRDMGSIMPWSNRVHEPQRLGLCSRAWELQLLVPRAVTTEAHVPRAWAPHQEKSWQCEAHAAPLASSPRSLQLEKRDHPAMKAEHSQKERERRWKFEVWVLLQRQSQMETRFQGLGGSHQRSVTTKYQNIAWDLTSSRMLVTGVFSGTREINSLGWRQYWCIYYMILYCSSSR